MEDVKKAKEAAKSEEFAERVELTDEELDQASGGVEQERLIHHAVDIAVGKNRKRMDGGLL